MICRVAFPIPLYREFDYRVPASMEADIRPGRRVKAPFGISVKTGWVTAVNIKTELPPGIQIKELESFVDSESLYGAELLPLAEFIASEWGCPSGEALGILFPSWVAEEPPKSRSVPDNSPVIPPLPKALTQSQSEALSAVSDAVSSGTGGEFLLFGAALSGKTEVYLRLTEQVLSSGGQVLLLIPDIALTEPFMDEIKARFGESSVYLWHSRLSAGQRARIWLALSRGEPRIVVGTRSACLLPFKNLKLAVIDEEQDEGYKNEDMRPYYHARDIVRFRAAHHKAAAVYGSCAPSMETLRRAIDGGIKMLRMKERVPGIGSYPEITVTGKRGANSKLVSDELYAAMQNVFSRNLQAMILLNRRGYSSAYACLGCGWFLQCPECGLAVPYSGKTGRKPSSCRRCGAKLEFPDTCPVCKNKIFRAVGSGTEKAQEELEKLFPGKRVIRLDADTYRLKHGEGRVAYQTIADGGADIAIGTRILSRGYNFPRLAMVGVLDADTEANPTDFRASEKTCQMLFQAAGRLSLRASRMVVQTSRPDEPLFKSLRSGDYFEFAMSEMESRRDFQKPPFFRMLRFVVTAKSDDSAEKACLALMEKAEKIAVKHGAEQGKDFYTMGPASCLPERNSRLRRHHFLVGASGDTVSRAIVSWASREKAPKGQEFRAVPDPVDFH